MNNRQVGNDMLVAALHKDCISDDGAVRKFTLKTVAKIDNQILASYVISSSPANGYTYNPDNLRFEFDNQHTAKVWFGSCVLDASACACACACADRIDHGLLTRMHTDRTSIRPTAPLRRSFS
jgi:hypothetical protein